MKGEIDQVDEIVRFEELNEEQMWNDQIKHTCDQECLILIYKHNMCDI